MKIHLSAIEDNGRITFKSNNGYELFRGGGNEKQANFVLEELVNKHGTLGVEIYTRFNEALITVNDRYKNKFPQGVGVFTLYTGQNESNKRQSKFPNNQKVTGSRRQDSNRNTDQIGKDGQDELVKS